MSKLMIAGVAVSAALSLSACATKDYVNTHVAAVQTQVDSLQGQQHDQGAQLAQVDQTSRDALQRAEAAGKLAEGKFMYQVVLSDDSMKFPLSSSQLSPEAQTRLMDFVQKLKADNKNVYLEIQGYTDNTGSAAENLRLGQERAEAVRRFMSQQGVALNRMSTISYGDEQPVAPNTTRVGRAQNRRVVLVVLA
jgi:outer membrane protein OmpA-like peptidoglycan-associated protein